MKVYLASSARNPSFLRVRDALLRAGHEVHDWTRGPCAYNWSEVGIGDPDACSVRQMTDAGSSTILQNSLLADERAIDDCDVFVLLLPAGADAHFELGYAYRFGTTPIYILSLSGFLHASQFYAVANGIFATFGELLEVLQ